MQRDNGTHDDGYMRGLAGFVANLRYDDSPPEVVERAKLPIRDSLGCALYAARPRDAPGGNPTSFEHRKSR